MGRPDVDQRALQYRAGLLVWSTGSASLYGFVERGPYPGPHQWLHRHFVCLYHRHHPLRRHRTRHLHLDTLAQQRARHAQCILRMGNARRLYPRPGGVELWGGVHRYAHHQHQRRDAGRGRLLRGRRHLRCSQHHPHRRLDSDPYVSRCRRSGLDQVHRRGRQDVRHRDVQRRRRPRRHPLSLRCLRRARPGVGRHHLWPDGAH